MLGTDLMLETDLNYLEIVELVWGQRANQSLSECS